MTSANRRIQNILVSEFPRYREQHKQPLRVLKAVEPQMNCRTRAQGFTQYRCPDDHETKEIHHSCRHRGCTVCSQRKQHEWLEKQKQRLLGCDHFHLVFTLPSEYHELWLHNRKWFIQTQFEVTSETLKDLLQEKPKTQQKHQTHLGATPGFISVLHTWGRQLNLHPHIHCLITACGLTKQGQWKEVNNDFLVPVNIVKALYRGKFQARIKTLIQSDAVNIPAGECRETLMMTHKQLYKKAWSVRIQEKYEHGKGVLIYLSRYLGSSPIKPQQIRSVSHEAVEFSFKDHRDGKYKNRRLTMTEFMRRLLIHQPERGIHTIRYYGLYGVQAKSAYATCLAFIGKAEKQKKTSVKSTELTCILKQSYQIFCDCCGAIMQPVYVHFKASVIKKTMIEGVKAALPARQGTTRSLCRPTVSDVHLRPRYSDIILNI